MGPDTGCRRFGSICDSAGFGARSIAADGRIGCRADTGLSPSHSAAAGHLTGRVPRRKCPLILRGRITQSRYFLVMRGKRAYLVNISCKYPLN